MHTCASPLCVRLHCCPVEAELERKTPTQIPQLPSVTGQGGVLQASTPASRTRIAPGGAWSLPPTGHSHVLIGGGFIIGEAAWPSGSGRAPGAQLPFGGPVSTFGDIHAPAALRLLQTVSPRCIIVGALNCPTYTALTPAHMATTSKPSVLLPALPPQFEPACTHSRTSLAKSMHAPEQYMQICSELAMLV